MPTLQVYKLYKAYKTGREVWSKTLWADLDPQILTDGIESYMKEFRKLPKQVCMRIDYMYVYT